MRAALLALLLAAAATGGCADGPTAAAAAGEDALTGEWRLEDLNGKGVIDDSMVTLAFGPASRAGGRGGCNRWFGTWSRQGTALAFSGLGSTRLACAEALMRQEAAFLSALQETSGYAFAEDGALVLTTRDGRRLLLRAASE